MLVAWKLGEGWMLASPLAAGLAMVATIAWALAPSSRSSRLSIAVAFMGIVSILLAACHGSAFQVDIHMYYFAAMAILAIYCDWEVILAAAGATAVHHLVLNFVAPDWLFPHRQSGSMLRTTIEAMAERSTRR